MKVSYIFATVIAVFCISNRSAYAQNYADAPSWSVAAQTDSTALAQPEIKVIVDSTLVGCDIFDIMPVSKDEFSGGVLIRQSDRLRDALRARISGNSLGLVPGYRIRIFFSNTQNARQASAAAAARFLEKFGTYSVYHSYTNPNFKVTVGDFRTKSEALELLSAVKRDFPSAFIVKENVVVNY